MDIRDATLVLKYAIAGSTVKRAFKVAIVVGPVLTLINHAPAIVTLNFGSRFVLQTVLTFCVPYLVSTYSSAMTEFANARAVAQTAGDTCVGGAR